MVGAVARMLDAGRRLFSQWELVDRLQERLDHPGPVQPEELADFISIWDFVNSRGASALEPAVKQGRATSRHGLHWFGGQVLNLEHRLGRLSTAVAVADAGSGQARQAIGDLVGHRKVLDEHLADADTARSAEVARQAWIAARSVLDVRTMEPVAGVRTLAQVLFGEDAARRPVRWDVRAWSRAFAELIEWRRQGRLPVGDEGNAAAPGSCGSRPG
jgi:hypothetical protein